MFRLEGNTSYTNCGDKLAVYNGRSITYDAIGIPLSYRGMTFTWQQGRQLASATLANGTAISYQYNPDGIRIGKTVGSVSTEYLVDDSGTIHAMKQGEHILIFMYDSTWIETILGFLASNRSNY